MKLSSSPKSIWTFYSSLPFLVAAAAAGPQQLCRGAQSKQRVNVHKYLFNSDDKNGQW